MRLRDLIAPIQEAAAKVPFAQVLNNPKFRAWFKGSKIVDKHGSPMVVYHGTASAFEAFEVATIGKVFSDDTHGFFFTNNTGSDMASGYAHRAARQTGDVGANVMPVFIRITNPFTFADYAYSYEYGDGTDPQVIKRIIDGRGMVPWFDHNKHAIIDFAMEEGHDGVFFFDPSTDLGDGTPENIVVAFRPEQIKSVFARQFDITSPKLSEDS